MVCFRFYFIYQHHQCSAQGHVLHCKRRNLRCSSAEGRCSTKNSGTKIAVLPGLNRCGSFPFFPHSSLYSIWTDLKRSKKIPDAPMCWWGEWIWLTGPFGLHLNLSQGLNISSIRVFDQIRDPEIPITLGPLIIIIIIIIIIIYFRANKKFDGVFIAIECNETEQK